jgi:hypothetical protein
MRTTTSCRLLLAVLLGAPGLLAVPADLLGQAGLRERTLFVSALDSKGEPVEGLGIPDFVVTEDGRRREVLRVSRAVEPIDIAVIVDNSEAAEGEILPIRESVKDFVSSMAGSHQIALVSIASRPTIYVDYTADPKRLADGIGRLFPQSNSGMTLMDGIFEVSNGLARRETTRAAIVAIITNGVDFSNRFSRETIDALSKANAGLHAFTIGELPIATDLDRERNIVVQDGTKASGGQRVALVTELGLNQALQRLARELKAQYKVVYSRPESFLPPEKVEVASGRTGVSMRGTPARGQQGTVP